MRKYWSKEDIDFLINNYEEGYEICAKYLDRTTNSVAKKACKLGLIRTYGKVKDSEAYIEELINKEIYYLPIESYKNSHKSIKHQCLNCYNIWNISPTNILTLRVCPMCNVNTGGFNENISAKVYCINLICDDIEYFKIGITNHSTKKRFSSDWNKFNMKELWTIHFEKGKEARQLEQKILKNYSQYKACINCLKSGNTEIVTVFIEKPNGYY